MASPIVHVDINADDLETSTSFYRDVFGWEIDSSFPGYPMFQAEGGPGGGFVKSGSEGISKYTRGALLYLNSHDIDASLQEVESRGGKTVLSKTEIEGGHGSFAVFTDPAGNYMGIYQPPPK